MIKDIEFLKYKIINNCVDEGDIKEIKEIVEKLEKEVEEILNTINDRINCGKVCLYEFDDSEIKAFELKIDQDQTIDDETKTDLKLYLPKNILKIKSEYTKDEVIELLNIYFKYFIQNNPKLSENTALQEQIKSSLLSDENINNLQSMLSKSIISGLNTISYGKNIIFGDNNIVLNDLISEFGLKDKSIDSGIVNGFNMVFSENTSLINSAHNIIDGSLNNIYKSNYNLVLGESNTLNENEYSLIASNNYHFTTTYSLVFAQNIKSMLPSSDSFIETDDFVEEGDDIEENDTFDNYKIDYSIINGNQILIGDSISYTILNGTSHNLISSEFNTINGANNQIDCQFSFINGTDNKIENVFCFLNGTSNISDSTFTFINGSQNEINSGTFNYINGSKIKIESSNFSIITGIGNQINDLSFGLLIGTGLTTNGSFCINVGSGSNINDAQYSMSLGSNKNISGYCNIGLGSGNDVNGENQIVTGHDNIVDDDSRYNLVLANTNEINDSEEIIIHGHGNKIKSSSGVIVSGNNQNINDCDYSLFYGFNDGLTSNYSLILGSGNNLEKNENIINFGYGNQIKNSISTMITGANNNIDNLERSILVGAANNIKNSELNLIIGYGINIEAQDFNFVFGTVDDNFNPQKNICTFGLNKILFEIDRNTGATVTPALTIDDIEKESNKVLTTKEYVDSKTKLFNEDFSNYEKNDNIITYNIKTDIEQNKIIDLGTINDIFDSINVNFNETIKDAPSFSILKIKLPVKEIVNGVINKDKKFISNSDAILNVSFNNKVYFDYFLNQALSQFIEDKKDNYSDNEYVYLKFGINVDSDSEIILSLLLITIE